jgi:hypothetical protein
VSAKRNHCGVLDVAGGDALYLSHWMRECGLADMTRSLDHTV